MKRYILGYNGPIGVGSYIAEKLARYSPVVQPDVSPEAEYGAQTVDHYNLQAQLEALRNLVALLFDRCLAPMLTEEQLEEMLQDPQYGWMTGPHSDLSPDQVVHSEPDPDSLQRLALHLTSTPEGLNAIRVALDMREEQIA